MTNQSRQISRGVIAAAVLFLVCIALRPSGLAANDGLSYYGALWITIVPYAAALFVYEFALWRAAQALGQSRRTMVLAIIMKIAVLMVIAVLLIPINVDEDIHSAFGIIVFLLELIVSLKLLRWGFHWLDAGLVALEFVAGAAAVYTARGDHGLLLQSQVIFQAAFIILLVRATSLLSKRLSQRSVVGQDDSDRTKVEGLLAGMARSSEDFFKLWPADKRYFWSAERDAFVAYKITGPTAFAIADPIAATPAQATQVLQKFLDYCKTQDCWACFIMVTEDSKSMYQQAGLKSVKIGASAVININTFVDETSHGKWWRWQRNRGQRLGYAYEFLAPPHSDAVLADLHHVSDIWLAAGHHREQGFALGYFDQEYLRHCNIHLLRNQQGEVVAFLNELPVFNHLPQATTDLLRFIPDAPGAMPYLMLNMLHKLAEAGQVTHFDLGFVPLGHMHGLLFTVARTLGGHRFSAAGLEQFKDKFEPVWHPNYLAYDGSATDLALIALNLEKAIEIEVDKKAS